LWTKGLLWWDDANGCVTADTGFTNVRTCIGQENYIPVYNGSGVTITNGTPVMTTGVYVGGVPSVIPADADSILSVVGFLGLATEDILDGDRGLSTILGAVNDVDTTLLAQAPVYLASGGGLTNTIPKHPTNRLLIGGVPVAGSVNGVIGVGPMRLTRPNLSRSYSFTSQGITSGTFPKGGFYDWSSTDANLTEAAQTVNYGTAGRTYAAHASIVPSGPGTVTGGGQVGLRVNGTIDQETGPQIAAQTGIITEDISTLTVNQYYETTEKFSGEIEFELYVVSGSPTSYSLDFNYGYSKYDDLKNKNFTLSAIECVWLGNATDSSFDIILYKHTSTGWTYAATGFIPGNSIIAQKSVDQQIESNVVNGGSGAWKRTNINEFIEGNDSEGFVIQVVTGSNNTIQTMDIHVEAFSEELG
jgi:hypothetical protein